MTTKLQQYEPTENGSFGPPLCGDEKWAAKQLGLRLSGSTTACGPQRSGRSLEAEFDAYLSDNVPASTLLGYWQVSNRPS